MAELSAYRSAFDLAVPRQPRSRCWPTTHDADGEPLVIDSVTQPVNGTVAITGGGTGLTYQPVAELLQRSAGTARHVHLHAHPGGSTATVSVTVTCLDDAPTAVDDTATVAEDCGTRRSMCSATTLNADGGPITIGSVTQPANGTVVVTGWRHRS